MNTVSVALSLIDTDLDWYISFRVSIHMNLVGGLFFHLVDVLLVVTLVEVGNGFLFCLAESRTVLQRVMRYAAIVSCAILAVIALVAFGIINASVALLSSPGSDWTDIENLWKAGEKLYAACGILLFVWAGILMGFSAHVYNKAKRSHVLGNSSALFLYAAILNLLTCLYSIIHVSLFLLAHVKIHVPSKTWAALSIVGPILTAWIYAAIVAIIVTIAVRKHNGIWTTVQSWTEEEERRPLLATDSNATGVDEHLPEASSGAVTT
ncbi:hypothetical protein SLS64_011769 [Diaporthe eres]|uniref:Transmembrane protein n=1 Tax=Diaporthe eres TaxID=83184 RepID=A0ABR1P3V2_DIAER